jgi:hypothetical protein
MSSRRVPSPLPVAAVTVNVRELTTVTLETDVPD